MPNYETVLIPQKESKFKSWKKKNMPKDSGADYDQRGAFKAGLTADPKTGHWPDTFKKPNHPTFSTQSKYARVPYAAAGMAGTWQGEKYVPAVGRKVTQLTTDLIRGAWVQDPDTGALVPREQYQRRYDRAAESARLRSELPAPQVMRNITPFANVAVDGKEIGSRSHKREMMKRHGLTEVGNEKRVTKRQAKRGPPMRESLKRAVQELSSR